MPFLRGVLAAVALVSQLLLGSLVLPDDATAGAAARLRAVVVLCSSHPTAPDPPVHHHRPVDPAACPLEIALELPAVILMPAVTVPLSAMSARPAPFSLPAARAPPVAVTRVRHARAPPRLA